MSIGSIVRRARSGDVAGAAARAGEKGDLRLAAKLSRYGSLTARQSVAIALRAARECRQVGRLASKYGLDLEAV